MQAREIRSNLPPGGSKEGEELSRCPVCEVYLRKNEGFTCPKCRRGPLCRSHKVPGRKECASCVFDARVKALGELKRQEQSIKSFLVLLQFFFLVFAVLFIATKTGIAETLEFLSYSIITDGTELLGGISVAGYVLFYLILSGQRRKIKELEAGVSSTEIRRFAR